MATSITGIGPTQFPASTSTSSATNGVLGQDDMDKIRDFISHAEIRT